MFQSAKMIGMTLEEAKNYGKAYKYEVNENFYYYKKKDILEKVVLVEIIEGKVVQVKEV